MEDLKDYYNSGWNIEYIPPITLDKERGVLIDNFRGCEDIKTEICPHEKILAFSNLSERYRQQKKDN